jgi:hypothetical protein
MSPEEAHMLKKQLSLNLHTVRAVTINESFANLVIDQTVSLDDYSKLLARVGLLNVDCPKLDSRF